MSPTSLFVPGKAIRGGIPIIFPWFGARGDGKPGPAHGFARTTAWEIESTNAADGKVTVALVLKSNDASTAPRLRPFHRPLSCLLRASLEMELEVHNEAPAEFVFEEALHTYFAIGDIDQVSVSGLEGTTRIDKTDSFKRKPQDGLVRIAKETDQVHLNTKATCIVHDPVWQRNITIEKSGSEQYRRLESLEGKDRGDVRHVP